MVRSIAIACLVIALSLTGCAKRCDQWCELSHAMKDHAND